MGGPPVYQYSPKLDRFVRTDLSPPGYGRVVTGTHMITAAAQQYRQRVGLCGT